MQTRKKIIENGLKYFASREYEGASMSEIAKETGITKSSIYSYFTGKEQLYLAVLNHVLLFQMEYCKYIQNVLLKIDKNSLKRVYMEVHKTSLQRQEIYTFWKKCLLTPPVELEELVASKTRQALQRTIDILENFFRLAKEKRLIGTEYEPRYLALTFYSLIGSVSLERNYTLASNKTLLKESMFDIFWQGIQ